jgi:hypothetical protein
MKRSMVAAALVPLVILALLYMAWPAWRAFFPLERAYNEAWNAWLADAALGQGPLYPGVSEFIVNNYPPLSFYLIGLLSKLGVDAVYVGRMLSLLATAGCGVAVALCIRRLGGARVAAALGGLWYVAVMARFHDVYVGMDDPNLLALSLMGLALAWFLSRLEQGRGVGPAVIAMVVAGFFKHTLLAIPLAALLWLALIDRRLALRAALIGAAASAIGLALCWLAYGGDFFRQMLLPREIIPLMAYLALDRLYWIFPALLIVALWAVCDRRSPAARLVAIFVAVSFVGLMLQKMGVGVDDNAQFELVFAVAMGLGLAFDRILALPLAARLGPDHARLAVILVLVLQLVLALRAEPFLMMATAAGRAEVAEKLKIRDQEVARIAAMPGLVACTFMTVCRAAGKPYKWDQFWMEQRAATTGRTYAELEAQARAQGLRFEEIDSRVAW